MDNIHKTGIEIEGEFTDELSSYLRQYGQMHGDGSVRQCNQFSDYCTNEKGEKLYPREFSSNPMSIDEVVKLLESLKERQSDYHHNESAGLHIHVSFATEEGVYVKEPNIWAKEFVRFFYDNMEKEWNEEWKLRASNNYCRALMASDKGIIKQKGRYYGINYSAYYEHKTVEFRIWPSNTFGKMSEYYIWTINKIKEFQNMKLERKKRIKPKELQTYTINRTICANSYAQSYQTKWYYQRQNECPSYLCQQISNQKPTGWEYWASGRKTKLNFSTAKKDSKKLITTSSRSRFVEINSLGFTQERQPQEAQTR